MTGMSHLQQLSTVSWIFFFSLFLSGDRIVSAVQRRSAAGAINYDTPEKLLKDS